MSVFIEPIPEHLLNISRKSFCKHDRDTNAALTSVSRFSKLDSFSELRTQNSELRTQNSELRTQNSELRTQNSELRTQNSELRTQNSELRTQNSELRTQKFISNNTCVYMHVQHKSMSYSCIMSWRLNNSYSIAFERQPCD